MDAQAFEVSKRRQWAGRRGGRKGGLARTKAKAVAARALDAVFGTGAQSTPESGNASILMNLPRSGNRGINRLRDDFSE